MPKFLLQGSYTPEGVKGLMAEGGSARLAAGTAAVESAGGTVESLYFAYGDTDVLGICDFPDAAGAAAVSLLINASGAISVTLTPLITAEELDAAAAKTPSYRAPGV
ncbi:MAG: GYD domain-containing protein [Acidimicrobiia bacterium]|nr:GYD domain-containing protein [Acidimicrobiia bacterium]